MALNTTEKEYQTSLENQIASLKQQLSDKVEALSAAHSSGAATQEALAKSDKALETEKAAHAATSAERDSLKEDAKEAGQVIADLSQQLSQAQNSTGKPAARQVEHEGKKYHVIVPQFRMMGSSTIRTAEEVTTGSDLLAELVRSKSGVLEEVPAA